MALDQSATRRLLVERARLRSVARYREIADASGVAWAQAWRAMHNHLWELNADCLRRGEPMLGVLVIRQDGEMGDEARRSICEHAAEADPVRYSGADEVAEQAFVREERARAYSWTKWDEA